MSKVKDQEHDTLVEVGLHSNMRENLLSTNEVEIFSTIFQPDNINKGISQREYKQLGGKKGILNLFEVDEKAGLDITNESRIEKLKAKYGDNVPKQVELTPFMHFVCEALNDEMLRVLLVAAFVSLVIGILQEGLAKGWIEGVAIFSAVILVVSISSVINYKKELEFFKLNKINKLKMVHVKRVIKKDGRVQSVDNLEINSDDLLVGDVLKIKMGDILGVDGVLINGNNISIDESPLTGESVAIKKTVECSTIIKDGHEEALTPFILSATQVKEGEGEMLICAVGHNTYSEKLREMIEAKSDDEEEKGTELQEALTILADRIKVIALYVASFIGIVMVLKEIIIRLATGDSVLTYSLIDTIVNATVITITVVVVAVPEGLPMAVTISLAYSLNKMYDENNLVKHLDASETMGNVNIICTDKTGTLTKGQMLINRLYTCGTDYGKSPDRDVKPITDMNKDILNLFVDATYNNVKSDTYFEKDSKGEIEIKGSSDTEVALLKFYLEFRIKYDDFKREKAINVLPFNSDIKYMASLYKDTKSGGYKIFVKGAPDRILTRCSYCIDTNLNSSQLEGKQREGIKSKIEEYAMNRMRTIMVAMKDINDKELSTLKEKYGEMNADFYAELCTGLTFITLLGIADEPREDVPAAIQKCNSAGVRVIMVTGDYMVTACAIAEKVNILSKLENNKANEAHKELQRMKKENQENAKRNSLKRQESRGVDKTFGIEDFEKEPKIDLDRLAPIYALEGEDFRILTGGLSKKQTVDPENPKKKVTTFSLKNSQKFAKVVKDLRVIARATPEDKFLLVLGLKEIGNIVAVTGDGTNDAPALRQANVGFAMGIKGTEIAKDAASIVLLDDNFSSIITAIKYGRNVYDCIRKFIQFQLSVNVVAVFMTLLGGIILKDSPLNSIQMLWVNLIMDSFASLALATEPPSDRLLLRKPYPKGQEIVTAMMYINVACQSIFQIILLTIIIFYGDYIFGVPSDRELSHFMWNDVNGYHFTIFFNIFVFLQVFNSINARKLSVREVNVFQNLFNNYLYILIQVITILGQIFLVQVGGRAVRTQPLSLNQHLGCLLIASLSLVVAAVTKTVLMALGVEDDDSKKTLEHIKKSVTRSESRITKSMPTSKSVKKN
jgi:Ca2+ transporting ATPase